MSRFSILNVAAYKTPKDNKILAKSENLFNSLRDSLMGPLAILVTPIVLLSCGFSNSSRFILYTRPNVNLPSC